MAHKKKSPPPTSERGEHILMKADIDAWKSGAPTKRARRNERVINWVWKQLDRIAKIQQTIDSTLERVYNELTGKLYEAAQGGMTLYHPDKKRRIMWEIKNLTVLNDNAERAIAIIQEFVDETRNSVNRKLSNDVAQFLEFLLSMQDRRRSTVKFTPQIAQFMRTKWRDPRLQQAAELLGEAFEPNRTKMYVRIEELKGDLWVKRV